MDNIKIKENKNNLVIYTSENKKIISKKIINIELNKGIMDIIPYTTQIFYEIFGENNFYKEGIIKTKDRLITSFTYNNINDRFFVKVTLNGEGYFHFFTPSELDKNNIIMEIKNKNDTSFENIFDNPSNLSLKYNSYDISKYHSEDENNEKTQHFLKNNFKPKYKSDEIYDDEQEDDDDDDEDDRGLLV